MGLRGQWGTGEQAKGMQEQVTGLSLLWATGAWSHGDPV